MNMIYFIYFKNINIIFITESQLLIEVNELF